MSAAPVTEPRPLRIGEVAERVGTTVRTVCYYEEIGLLPGSAEREHGRHRLYSTADVERLEQVLRLKQLLGLSLDELKGLVEGEEARAALRAEWRQTEDDAERQRRILRESLGHIDRQLALVDRRRRELEGLAGELEERRARVDGLLTELG
jgi:MerR family transcriptional regulator, repressor of the yfmOP operon